MANKSGKISARKWRARRAERLCSLRRAPRPPLSQGCFNLANRTKLLASCFPLKTWSHSVPSLPRSLSYEDLQTVVKSSPLGRVQHPSVSFLSHIWSSQDPAKFPLLAKLWSHRQTGFLLENASLHWTEKPKIFTGGRLILSASWCYGPIKSLKIMQLNIDYSYEIIIRKISILYLINCCFE